MANKTVGYNKNINIIFACMAFFQRKLLSFFAPPVAMLPSAPTSNASFFLSFLLCFLFAHEKGTIINPNKKAIHHVITNRNRIKTSI